MLCRPTSYFGSVAKHATTSTARQGRKEKAHQTDVQWPADIRTGENLRANQILGGSGTRQARVRIGHDRITSEGK